MDEEFQVRGREGDLVAKPTIFAVDYRWISPSFLKAKACDQFILFMENSICYQTKKPSSLSLMGREAQGHN